MKIISGRDLKRPEIRRLWKDLHLRSRRNSLLQFVQFQPVSVDWSQPIFSCRCTRSHPRGERQIRHGLEGLNAAEKNEHDATIIRSCVMKRRVHNADVGGPKGGTSYVLRTRPQGGSRAAEGNFVNESPKCLGCVDLISPRTWIVGHGCQTRPEVKGEACCSIDSAMQRIAEPVWLVRMKNIIAAVPWWISMFAEKEQNSCQFFPPSHAPFSNAKSIVVPTENSN